MVVGQMSININYQELQAERYCLKCIKDTPVLGIYE